MTLIVWNRKGDFDKIEGITSVKETLHVYEAWRGAEKWTFARCAVVKIEII